MNRGSCRIAASRDELSTTSTGITEDSPAVSPGHYHPFRLLIKELSHARVWGVRQSLPSANLKSQGIQIQPVSPPRYAEPILSVVRISQNAGVVTLWIIMRCSPVRRDEMSVASLWHGSMYLAGTSVKSSSREDNFAYNIWGPTSRPADRYYLYVQCKKDAHKTCTTLTSRDC
ncbi:hypothetical protein N657DRAFT_641813 [Parathielavia appendiculata]|uniref:Uncharacterized protein n=1 Tax=Parathielavia appendiculata TaxID=2587402 RepID=A0AAN6U7N7_9PEZI|nr:hypothetical protein N657DRAFT_641813 [Parathielavia appendiculata]